MQFFLQNTNLTVHFICLHNPVNILATGAIVQTASGKVIKGFCHISRISCKTSHGNTFQIYLWNHNFILNAYHRYIRPPPQAITLLTKHSIMLEETAASRNIETYLKRRFEKTFIRLEL